MNRHKTDGLRRIKVVRHRSIYAVTKENGVPTCPLATFQSIRVVLELEVLTIICQRAGLMKELYDLEQHVARHRCCRGGCMGPIDVLHRPTSHICVQAKGQNAARQSWEVVKFKRHVAGQIVMHRPTTDNSYKE